MYIVPAAEQHNTRPHNNFDNSSANMIFVYCEAQENKMALTVAKQQRPNPADNDDDDADRSCICP